MAAISTRRCIAGSKDAGAFVSPLIAAKLAERVGGVELTEREIVVLRALATGQSNKEIRRSLFISARR